MARLDMSIDRLDARRVHAEVALDEDALLVQEVLLEERGLVRVRVVGELGGVVELAVRFVVLLVEHLAQICYRRRLGHAHCVVEDGARSADVQLPPHPHSAEETTARTHAG